MILLLLVTLLLSSNIAAYPSAIPLAVRSPYLNSWLYYMNEPESSLSELSMAAPTFGRTWVPAPSGRTWTATTNYSQVCHFRIFSWAKLVTKFSTSLCQILGWSVLVRVDGVTYSFLGNSLNDTVNVTDITIGPANSIIIGQVGPMRVNLTFSNPIEVRSHSSVTFNVHICNI